MTDIEPIKDPPTTPVEKKTGDPFNAQPYLLLAAIVTALSLMFASAYSAWISAHAHHSSCARNDITLNAVQQLAFDFIDPPAKPGTVITKQRADAIASAELDVTQRLDAARC